jgi:hypothetical protein
MHLSSCSARTPVKSLGLKSIAECTRRELRKRLPRNVRAELSNISVVSLVLILPPLRRREIRLLLRDRNNDWLRFRRPSQRKRIRNPRKPRCVFKPIILQFISNALLQPAARPAVPSGPKVSKQQMKGGKGGR